jgi:hypothetical protein
MHCMLRCIKVQQTVGYIFTVVHLLGSVSRAQGKGGDVSCQSSCPGVDTAWSRGEGLYQPVPHPLCGCVGALQGNYTQYVAAKSEKEALQWTAYEKQQKEIDKLQDMVRRLSGEQGVGGGCG